MRRRLKDLKESKIERPQRLNLSAKESLKRTKEVEKRKEQFITAIRRGIDELEHGQSIALEEVDRELPSFLIKS
jgi:hypothetical protein